MNTLFLLIIIVNLYNYVYCQGQGQVTVVNGCSQSLLIETEAGSWTSKQLNAGQQATVTFPYEDARPRVWALRGCTGTDEMSCIDFHRYQTRQFNSLAEFNWKNAQLWYDISAVDGYTTSISIDPYIPGNPAECASISCKYNVNNCQGNKIQRNGTLAGCQNPSIDNASPYSQSIKQSCPNAYTYSSDEKAAKYTCVPNPKNGLKITFYC